MIIFTIIFTISTCVAAFLVGKQVLLTVRSEAVTEAQGISTAQCTRTEKERDSERLLRGYFARKVVCSSLVSLFSGLRACLPKVWP